MIAKPYLIFTGDITIDNLAKTAFGLRDWAGSDVVGQWRLQGGTVDLNIPMLAPADASAYGARSLVIGVATMGGKIPESWHQTLVQAMEAGLDLVSGMHDRLNEIPALVLAAQSTGRQLHDVRHPKQAFPIGTGQKRPGKRLLTVGTDCALGKKYTALALARALKEHGYDADFRATGQTGIMIAGEGVAIDAVVSDFLAGAAETLSPAADPQHWDVIEGQGALFHPAYAGVTLGLIHGSQPDAMILCHDPSRTTILEFPWAPIPPLGEAMLRYVDVARTTNPDTRFVGISVNTSRLGDDEAHELAQYLQTEHGLPVCDPMRFGIHDVVEEIALQFGGPL
jgi:uncharacterized NAD-dependent epimerase/dehydratase family protein